jgi:putative flippase GtrA
MTAGSSGALGPSTVALLVKHQASSFLATTVDFGVMILAHEIASLSPTLSTVVGATCGAIVNFMLGRHWTFRATSDRAHAQAVKYAVVSATSLALNALGEHLLADRLHVQYVVARLCVALAVSVLWNFPLQRAFVFAEKKKYIEERRGR